MCGKHAGRLGQYFNEAKLSLYISRPLKRLGCLLSLKGTKKIVSKIQIPHRPRVKKGIGRICVPAIIPLCKLYIN